MNSFGNPSRQSRAAAFPIRTTAVILMIALLGTVTALGTANVLAQSPRAPQIVGGQEADPGEWPWQVALVSGGNDLYAGLVCGGSLIAADWVLTTASCVASRHAGGIDVVAGVHDLSAPEPDFQRRTVARIVVHPDWNSHIYDNNIALLRLSSPIDERPAGGGSLPIAWLNRVSADAGDLAGADTTVTGWGNRAADPPGGIDYPTTLHEVVVPVVSNEDCVSVHGSNITDNMICAGPEEGGKDACSGDGGGPLVYNDSGAWQLAGLVSHGTGCAGPGFFGIYTRVSRYVNWIDDVMSSPPGSDDSIFFPVVVDMG